jgi:sugar/nucleoside kinase (ribokinase family)
VGGDATNQSIVLSRLGINSVLISGVGNDSAGAFITNYIKATDVNSDYVRVIENSTSPIGIVVIDKEGERSFIFSNLDIIHQDQFLPNLENIQDIDVVSLGSMFGSPIFSRKNIETVLKAAKDAGAAICADMIVASNTDRLNEVGDLLSNIDFVFPNEDEARAFTGKEDVDDISDHLLDYGIKHVVLKRGRRGCLLKSKQERFFVPAYEVEAVDTTGAGDNFVAGFITALLDQKPLKYCCQFGCATAAVNILEMGANSGVKSKEQVIQFMKDYSGN